ncbi:hypothetical protein OAS39_01330 [Pirellulales bacterium]|nr:hypothetical protein [Pirellulales bacterium]
MRKTSIVWILSAAIGVTTGCSDLPSRVPLPGFDPQEIAASAIQKLDADGDSMLSAEEMAETPSLGNALSRLDSDGDQRLNAAEIQARVEQWQEYRAGLSQTTCAVVRKGIPVPSCRVTYHPEEFMLGSIVPAYAITTGGGNANVSVAKEHRPGPAYKGVQSGFYRIEVTLKDGSKVEDLVAGAEVAGDLQNVQLIVLP